MNRLTHVLLGAAVVGSLSATGLLADSSAEIQGLEDVKNFTLEHNAELVENADLMLGAVRIYAGIIAAHDGDYSAAWKADGAALAKAIEDIRGLWLKTSNQYETMEGIVAGIPATVKYDMILDAGNPGTETVDVAEYDLTLPDGTVLKRPGSLFHHITEPLFWGMDPVNVVMTADLNGDGNIGRGEMLFDANLALGAAEALSYWAKALKAELTEWKPNRDDAFTAVVTMTPTVGDYFGEWKESQFITGDIGAFVAQSRLVDVQGIMGGCKKMYFSAISPVVKASDPNLDQSIRAGYEELLALVKETYEREYAGEKFGAEEADAIGNEAQDIADRIVAMVLQAAAKNGVTLKM